MRHELLVLLSAAPNMAAAAKTARVCRSLAPGGRQSAYGCGGHLPRVDSTHSPQTTPPPTCAIGDVSYRPVSVLEGAWEWD